MREQPDFSTTPRPRRPPARELLAVALGFVVLLLAVGSASATRREAGAARNRLAAVRREIDSLEARLRAAEARTTQGGELLSWATAAGEAPPERIVAAVARALPADARVEHLVISYGDAISLEMLLVARDAAAWDRALARLVEAGPFEEVTPGPERREGEIRTSVSARWAEER
ncbi:MAG: hypothetical protein LJF30_20350 [Acidobacteria bacterium]|nr:hypothetical protein [Acidobacteriota bacterium]